ARRAVSRPGAARAATPSAHRPVCARRINPKAINKRVLESLAASGAFDALEPNRARAHAAVEAMLATAQRTHEAVSVGQNDMFGGLASRETIAIAAVEPLPSRGKLPAGY